ncbi:MAG: hypothetical protein AAGF15_00545 [Pseudomonadota bacterium]
MNTTALILIYLSLPGAAFQFGLRGASRIGRRGNRDVFRALTVWIPIALPVLGLSNYFASHIGISAEALLSLETLENGTSSVGDYALFSGITVVIGSFLGAATGKLWVWRSRIPGARRTAMERMAGGILPSLLEANVLTTMSLGQSLLFYRGQVADIQLSPEGDIEYIVLAQNIEKSLIFNGNDSLAGNPPTDGLHPKPSLARPLMPIAEFQSRDYEKDRLLIEASTIANVHFEVYEDAGDASWLDEMADRIWNFRRRRKLKAEIETLEKQMASEDAGGNDL